MGKLGNFDFKFKVNKKRIEIFVSGYFLLKTKSSLKSILSLNFWDRNNMSVISIVIRIIW